jgi:hypothetical protein
MWALEPFLLVGLGRGQRELALDRRSPTIDEATSRGSLREGRFELTMQRFPRQSIFDEYLMHHRRIGFSLVCRVVMCIQGVEVPYGP